jgi:hypothetical protein
MISKEKKFIFIHNFKTGGTSIEYKLGHFETLERDVQDHRTIREIELLTNRKHFLRMTFYALKIGKPKRAMFYFKNFYAPVLTKSEYDSFFKFTFVRSTWARVYSWYANVMQDDVLRKSYHIEDSEYSFKDFLTEKLNHKTYSLLHFLKDSKGDIPMDFIGRFENLQEDFNSISKTLGLEDGTLPKLLVRNRKHYTDFYTEETKSMVYQFYKEEIEYFGFKYGE